MLTKLLKISLDVNYFNARQWAPQHTEENKTILVVFNILFKQELWQYTSSSPQLLFIDPQNSVLQFV